MSRLRLTSSRLLLAVTVFAAVLAASPAAHATPRTLQGTLMLFHADDTEHGEDDSRHDHRSHEQWQLHTTAGARVPLEVGPAMHRTLRPGAAARVTGELRAGRLEVSDEPGALAMSDPQGAPAGGPEAAPGAGTGVTGSRRMAVILANFADVTSEPVARDAAERIVFTGSDSTRAWMEENSRDSLDVTGADGGEGDVFGWYTLSTPSTGCPYLTWAQEARTAAAADGFVEASYDYIMYVHPPVSGCPGGGWAYVGGRDSWNLAYNESYLRHVTIHETGHSFGNRHAGSRTCIDADGVAVAAEATCYRVEYGDPFDPMGQADALHTSAYHKMRLGWLPEGRQVNLDKGSGTVTLAPQAWEPTDPSAPQLLRVPILDSYGYPLPEAYYVEYRQPYGFDRFTGADPSDGVLIRRADMYYGGQRTQLVDNSPWSASPFDATLKVGQTFYDPSGVRITLRTLTPEGATVDVSRAIDTVAPGSVAIPVLDGRSLSSANVVIDPTAKDDVGVHTLGLYMNGKLFQTLVRGSSGEFRNRASVRLTAGVPARITMAARDQAGNVGRHSAALVVDTRPSAPPSLRVGSQSDAAVTLRWNASTDDLWVEAYRVYRDGIYLGRTTTLSYTDGTIEPNRSYQYQVRAVDSARQRSLASTLYMDGTRPQRPAAPLLVERTSTSITVRWTAPYDNVGVAHYRIYRNGSYVASTVGTTWRNGGRAPATLYTYSIRAVDAAGNVSPRSDELSVRTLR